MSRTYVLYSWFGIPQCEIDYSNAVGTRCSSEQIQSELIEQHKENDNTRCIYTVDPSKSVDGKTYNFHFEIERDNISMTFTYIDYEMLD